MGLFKSSSSSEKEGSNADGFGEYVDTLVSDTRSAENELLVGGIAKGSVQYGIDNTIKLLRKLPIDNPKVVVKIVLETLESVDVDVSMIITDANNKVSLLEQHIDSLSSEIQHFEQQIAQKKEEILESKNNLDEMFKVRDLLKEQATLEKQSTRQEDNPSAAQGSKVDVISRKKKPSTSANDDVKDVVSK